MTIDPSKIPGLDIDVESIRTSASDLSTKAGDMRTSGATIKSNWAAMSGCYQAPEQEKLYAAMDPVATTSDALAGDLESIAKAVGDFADTAEVIKADAVALQGRAQDFLDTTGADPEWMYDQGNVDKHTGLVDEASALQVRLWEAERECANTIRALDGLAGYHADQQSKDDTLFYGMSEIPSGSTGLPWGDPVERHDHCLKKAGTSVWRGLYNDFVLETVNGLTGLVGLNLGGPEGATWSAENAAATWQGFGGLLGLKWDEFGDFESWSWGNAGDAWGQVIKGTVAWDMWGEDPLRARTTFAANGLLLVGTTVIGALTKLGKVGTASRLARLGQAVAVVDRILSFMDPLGTLLGAGAARVGSWVIRTTGIHFDLQGLLDSWRKPADFDVPDVEAPSTHPGSAVDVDSVGDLDLPPARTDAPHAADADAPRADVPDADAPHVGDADAPSTDAPKADAPHVGDVDAPRTDAPDSSAPHAGNADTPGHPDSGGHGDADASGAHSNGDGASDGMSSGGDGDPFNAAYRPEVSSTVEVGADHPLAPSARKPFGRDMVLEPNTVYHVEGRGDFYTNADGTIVHVEAASAATNGGTINPDLNDPLPNSTYTVDNRFHYTTDEYGRTVRCEVDRLEVVDDRVRKPHIQSTVAGYGADLPGTYEGGHLIGTQYGGPPESINLVPQLQQVNRGPATSNGGNGSYLTFETRNRNHPYANIDIGIEYDELRSGMPVDEVPVVITVDAFDITLGQDIDTLRFTNR